MHFNVNSEESWVLRLKKTVVLGIQRTGSEGQKFSPTRMTVAVVRLTLGPGDCYNLAPFSTCGSVGICDIQPSEAAGTADLPPIHVLKLGTVLTSRPQTRRNQMGVNLAWIEWSVRICVRCGAEMMT